MSHYIFLSHKSMTHLSQCMLYHLSTTSHLDNTSWHSPAVSECQGRLFYLPEMSPQCISGCSSNSNSPKLLCIRALQGPRKFGRPSLPLSMWHFAPTDWHMLELFYLLPLYIHGAEMFAPGVCTQSGLYFTSWLVQRGREGGRKQACEKERGFTTVC